MRASRRIARTLLSLGLVVVCSGPVFNCECDEGNRIEPPELVVDKTVLQFDNVAVGYPQTRVLKISSTGGVGLVFSKLAVAGGQDSPFAVLGMLDAAGSIVALPDRVGLGASIDIVVQYDPATEDASDFDTLDIVTNDPDPCPSAENQCAIQLNGTGAPPDAELDVVCQQDDICPLGDTPLCRIILDGTNTHPVRVALNFCEVPSGRNLQLDVLLRNIGNIPLTMAGFELDASSSPYYALLSPDEASFQILPGEERMLSVNYAPEARGAHQGSVDVLTNDLDLVYAGVPDGTFSLRLLGLSAEPDIDVNPTNVPFTGVVQGSQASETIRINNTGDAYLIIDAIEVTGGSVAGEFFVDNDQGFEIQPAGSANLIVTYAPQDVGADDGSILIHSNDPDEAQVVVTLGGEVRPDLDVTPASVLEFIDVPAGEQAFADVTLRNLGYADLTIGALAFSSNPGDPPVFSLSNLPPGFPGSPIVLAPAEAVTFQVGFWDNTLIEDEVGQLDIAHDSPSDVQPYPLLVVSTGTPANLPPVAIVDPPTQVVHGLAQISLSAANSFDPDAGDSVAAYGWSFLFKPQDAQGNVSQAVLDSTDQMTTTFTPDMIGNYVVRLVVFDTFNAMSTPVDAEISVNP
jgi:hypothetical protein